MCVCVQRTTAAHVLKEEEEEEERVSHDRKLNSPVLA